MYSDYYETLIHKHLAGELTHEEELSLKEWLEESPEHQAHLEEAERIWEFAGLDDGAKLNIDLDHEMARFKERVQADPPATVLKAKGLRLVWRYAAAAVILIGAVLFGLQLGADDGGVILVETEQDETREVILPDNSTLLLNENSRIFYSADFSDRFIQMSGEVFFDVTRDESRPFRIQSGKSTVEVLGTSFVVRYIADEPDIRVTVSSGQVAFTAIESNQREVLTPGYQGTFLKATNELSVAPNNDPDYQVWRNRTLLFEDAPFLNVIEELKLHFGIVIEDPDAALEACTVTGEFDAPPLEEVLQLLSFSLDINVSVQDGIYEFSGIGCMQ